VDDLADKLLVRKMMLETLGYRVLTATSPKAALNVMVRGSRPGSTRLQFSEERWERWFQTYRICFPSRATEAGRKQGA